MHKSLMNVQSSSIPNSQPAKLVEPRERALDHPSVLAQLLAALNATSGYSRCNASISQSSSASLKIVPLVSMQLGWSLPSSPTNHSWLLDRFDGVHHIGESNALMNVSRSTDYREWHSFGVDDNVAL